MPNKPWKTSAKMEGVDKIDKTIRKNNIEIVEVKKVSDHVVHSLQKLLPQLTVNYKSFNTNDLEEVLSSEATRLFTAIDRENDNKIVGAYALVIFRIPTSKIIRIEDVVVDESRRGEGIGKAMMNHALEFAANEGDVKVELYSHPSRVAANNLYQSLGYKIMKANVYRYTGY